jgi:hypothetical protein
VSERVHDSVVATDRKRSLAEPLLHQVPAAVHPSPNAHVADLTSPQRNTHISERRTVHYPWHPWRDRSVFIDGGVEKNGRVIFRCHVEETQQWRALEIPDWMFGSVCSTMCVVDTPRVTCEALRKVKVLLAGASNHDPAVKEGQRFEGGV